MSAPIPVPPARFLRLALDITAQIEDAQYALSDARRALEHHGLDRSRAATTAVLSWSTDYPEQLCRELHERGEHEGWYSACDCANDVRAERSLELQMRVRYPQGGDW